MKLRRGCFGVAAVGLVIATLTGTTDSVQAASTKAMQRGTMLGLIQRAGSVT
jgi:hypothetical protein